MPTFSSPCRYSNIGLSGHSTPSTTSPRTPGEFFLERGVGLSSYDSSERPFPAPLPIPDSINEPDGGIKVSQSTNNLIWGMEDD